MGTQVEDFVDGTVWATRFWAGKKRGTILHINMTMREFVENCNTKFVSIDDRGDERPWTLLQALEVMMKDFPQTNITFDQEFEDCE